VLVSPEEAGWGPLDLQAFLEAHNIESRPLWKPMHMQPLYKDARYVGGRVAERLFEIGLAMPSGSVLTDGEINRVLDTLTDFLAQR
jgi:dTDP-4-amino-4,6-dideoxygalactose transaminase